MKRSSLVVALFILLSTLIAVMNSHPVSAGAVSTATPRPTLTASSIPTATPKPVAVKASKVYFHSSGIMSLPEVEHWPLAEQGGEELTLPNTGSQLTRAGVTFINNDALSVVHAFVENRPSRPITTITGQDKLFDQEYWNEAWANFTGGWKETARRNDGRRFVVDFDLYLEDAVYRGRQVSRVENNWLVVLRLVAPKNNPRLMEDLDKAVWPGITLYSDAVKTPPEWVSIIDQTAGYMVRVPDDWTVVKANPGKPFEIRGKSRDTSVTLKTKVESGHAVRTDQLAQIWVKALHSDAIILSTQKETRVVGSGFSVSYLTRDEAGKPARGSAVMLNGPAYTLYSLDVLTPVDSSKPVGIENMNATLILLTNSLILFPAKQAVYGGAPVLLPSRTPMPTGTPTQTPMPTATLDPGSFDMSSAHTFTSPDGVLSLSLPRGWNTTQETSDYPFYVFYLGDSPGQLSNTFQIVIGDLDNIGLNPDETVSGDARQILETIKEQTAESDPGTYGKVEETKIGSVRAYKLPGRIVQQEPGMTVHFELRLARLSQNQWIYVSVAGEEQDWSRLQAVFSQIMDSVTVNVDKLPQALPSATSIPGTL